MTPNDFRALARESADMARMARFHQYALLAMGRTELAREASFVAGEVADAHTAGAIYLDQAACQLARETA